MPTDCSSNDQCVHVEALIFAVFVVSLEPIEQILSTTLKYNHSAAT